MREITNIPSVSSNDETTQNLQGLSGQELHSAKKQWAKPEAKRLNINQGGDATIDEDAGSGPATSGS